MDSATPEPQLGCEPNLPDAPTTEESLDQLRHLTARVAALESEIVERTRERDCARSWAWASWNRVWSIKVTNLRAQPGDPTAAPPWLISGVEPPDTWFDSAIGNV